MGNQTSQQEKNYNNEIINNKNYIVENFQNLEILDLSFKNLKTLKDLLLLLSKKHKINNNQIKFNSLIQVNISNNDLDSLSGFYKKIFLLE